MSQKRKRKQQANQAMLPVMRPDAAGIDIGATEIFVDQMNLQLHHVISGITGQTGLAIVDAILVAVPAKASWPCRP